MRQQSTDIPDSLPPRRFEFADDRSYKFWTIALDGRMLTTRSGRIGNQGQMREVRFDSKEKAKQSYLQRIRRKTREGYEERIPSKKKHVTSEDAWEQLADHEPFLAAILESPDEEMPHAIYADWLSERQDEKGEFIRLQLSLEDPLFPMFRRAKVEKAATLIRQRHARQWLGNLAALLMDDGTSNYTYDFHRGQLASIHCNSLGHRFAWELQRSPHCRFLSELAFAGTEVLADAIQLGDRRFDPDQDHTIEILCGGDFGNLRELHIGKLPDAIVQRPVKMNTRHAVAWIASMPRLERLWIQSLLDLEPMLKLPLENLIELHVHLDRRFITLLAQSGKLQQLSILGAMNPITDDLIDDLLGVEGFDQLTEFACHAISGASDSAIARLKETGIVVNVMNFMN